MIRSFCLCAFPGNPFFAYSKFDCWFLYSSMLYPCWYLQNLSFAYSKFACLLSILRISSSPIQNLILYIVRSTRFINQKKEEKKTQKNGTCGMCTTFDTFLTESSGMDHNMFFENSLFHLRKRHSNISQRKNLHNIIHV